MKKKRENKKKTAKTAINGGSSEKATQNVE